MSTQNTNMKETEGFNFNWKGTLKWVAITGVIGAAYYLGKKQGAKQEALKHQVVSEPVVTTTVETPEI